MRSIGIVVATLCLTAGVIWNAFYQKKQFYPSMVYLMRSSPSMGVIYFQALLLVFALGKLVRKIFFGQLRAAEFEHLVERSWYAVTETCLAFTVFKDDFSPKFVALFTMLLFVKVFHWLAEDRVDYMERSPVVTWLFHIRMSTLLFILSTVDVTCVSIAYNITMTKGASVQLVFGFEYCILLTNVINILVKYVLHTIDIHRDVFWENKAVIMLYLELVIGFLRAILYLCFVLLMVKLYTLPLFAFRPMYQAVRSFKRAFYDILMSRQAIRNMDTLYPDATPEDLANSDNVCIICREEMVGASKKLPCNHIFHNSCLRSWFQRHQTCPTCRLNVLQPGAMEERVNRNRRRLARNAAQARNPHQFAFIPRQPNQFGAPFPQQPDQFIPNFIPGGHQFVINQPFLFQHPQGFMPFPPQQFEPAQQLAGQPQIYAALQQLNGQAQQMAAAPQPIIGHLQHNAVIPPGQQQQYILHALPMQAGQTQQYILVPLPQQHAAAPQQYMAAPQQPAGQQPQQFFVPPQAAAGPQQFAGPQPQIAPHQNRLPNVFSTLLNLVQAAQVNENIRAPEADPLVEDPPDAAAQAPPAQAPPTQAPTPQPQQDSTDSSTQTSQPAPSASAANVLPQVFGAQPALEELQRFQPMPPTAFAGYADIDLNEMALPGERGIDARIRCLTHLRLFLESSVILVNQQLSAMQALRSNAGQSGGISTTQPSSSTTQASSSTTQASSSTTLASSSATIISDQPSTSASANNHSDQPSASGVSLATEKKTTIPQAGSDEGSIEVTGEELRRRRVEKLSTPSETNATNSD